MTNAITKPCTKAEAQLLTDRIRQNVDQLWSLLLEAHDRRAWKALGYGTFDDYVKSELPIGTRRAYQLIDQGSVIREISAAAGVDVQHVAHFTARDVAAVKDDLPAVADKIRVSVGSGDDPKKAIKEAVAAQRAAKAAAKAERDAQQAEWDRDREKVRQDLAEKNPKVAAGQSAKARNGSHHAAVAGAVLPPTPEPDEHPDAISAHRDELLEEATALRADVVERDRRIATFDGMAVQFEQGGFDAVVATKDERIRGLLRQIEDATADRAKLAKSRDFWRKTAIDLGYVSPNSQTEIEQPKPDAGLAEEAGF
ncbi:MAG: hypothetical protein ACOH2N_14930 [Devosia sp.]